jgi:hypothetical protein
VDERAVEEPARVAARIVVVGVRAAEERARVDERAARAVEEHARVDERAARTSVEPARVEVVRTSVQAVRRSAAC